VRKHAETDEEVEAAVEAFFDACFWLEDIGFSADDIVALATAAGQRPICVDCGIDAWNQPDGHEDFYVHNDLWDSVCPDDNVKQWVEGGVTLREGTFVICIECFEERLGRRLTPSDFKSPAEPLFGQAPTARFVDRAGL
jgi:hypothetical protein